MQDRFAEVMRSELGHAGAGEQSDTGLTDHVRFVSTEASIMDLAAPLLRRGWLRPLSAQRVANASPGTTLSVELVPRVTQLSVVSRSTVDDESEVASIAAMASGAGVPATLAIEVVAYVRVESREERQRLTTTALSELGVQLEFGADGWLLVNASEMSNVPPVFDLTSVGADYRDQVSRIAVGLFDELVADADVSIRLAQWSTLTVAGRVLDLTPSSLTSLPDGSLHIGFVTALRPVGAMAAPRVDGHLAASWWVHPDLPRAAVEYYAVTGALPRRYNAAGESDVVGAYAVTVGDVRVRDSELSESLRWWCIEGARCAVDDVAITRPIVLANGRVSLGGAQVIRGSGETASLVDGWLRSSAAIIEDVLSPPEIRLQGGERLTFSTSRLRIGPGSLRQGGTITTLPSGLGPAL